MDNYLGFIEFFVVAMFALAWGVLELVGQHLDKKRAETSAVRTDETPARKKTSDA